MSVICQICGKHKSMGRSQQHSRGIAGKRWKKRAQETPRLFMPNLQMKTVVVGDGSAKQMKLCTKCIKRIKNFGSVHDFKNVKFA